MDKKPIKTKDELFIIAKTWLNLDPDGLKLLLKENGLEGKFDAEKWTQYIALLASKVRSDPVTPPCEICGGEMILVRRFWSPNHLVCKEHSIHTSAVFVANYWQAFNHTITREEAIRKACGDPCVHKVPLIECKECLEAARVENLRKNGEQS